jgi:hypothetical protein
VYELRGVIATQAVLAPVAAAFDVQPVPLRVGDLWLLPLTDERYRRVTGASTFLCSSVEVPPVLAELMIRCSAAGPVAYVQADCFGGECAQMAHVWWEGELAMGPLSMEPGAEYDPSPISQALRTLGVERGGWFDEFDMVGLGRHRETADWLG